MKNISHLFQTGIVRNFYTYSDYMLLMEQVVREGRTTGATQSEDLTHYTKLNLHRMQRINKTVVINEDLKNAMAEIQIPQTWYILTEAWCGDAAQILPILNFAAEMSPVVDVKLLLRDENLDLMDGYLSGGARSIPKLVAVDRDFNELFTWGPRPAGTQALLYAYKANPAKSHSEFSEEIQRWYIADKGQSVQKELITLVSGVLS